MRLLVLAIALILAKDSSGQRSLEQCGLQKITVRHFIVRGDDAYPGQFPWHAALFYRGSYVCGGSLVSANYVLTAAHCTRDGSDREMRTRHLKVYLGLYNMEFDDEDGNAEKYSVHEIHTVPLEGSWRRLKNDIALLELSRSVDFTDYIQPICLNYGEALSRDMASVAGWGRTERGTTSRVLKTASMPIIETEDCVRSNPYAFSRTLDEGMICAGHRNGTGVCHGDSGSGLVVKRCTAGEECVWFVVGIVSMGSSDEAGNCKSKEYAIFTKVQTYLPWISQVTGLQFEEPSRKLDIDDDYSDGAFDKRQDETIPARWPWHGILHRVDSNFIVEDISEGFGVTILTNRLVLTTVQCLTFYNGAPEAYRVRVGHPAIGRSDRFTQELAIVAAYSSDRRPKHIRSLVMFKLEGRIEFTKYVQPISLWPADDSSFDQLVNRTGHLLSYGQSLGGTQPQTIAMPLVPKNRCLPFPVMYEVALLNAPVFCAGTSRTGAAEPDGLDIGGGLYVRRGSEWFLRGIMIMPLYDDGVSEIHLKEHNVMFVDVTHFSKWIDSVIANQGRRSLNDSVIANQGRRTLNDFFGNL